MTFKEIQELIKQINKSNLAEFKVKDGEFELAIRTKHFNKQKLKNVPQLISQPTIIPTVAPLATAAPAAAPQATTTSEEKSTDSAENNDNYLEVKSPMVGTFYRSQSPDKPAYVKVGDVLNVGSPVCIIEAMKLFNEIESEVAGTIVKVLVEDAQPVEYDQVLFLVEPN